MNKKVECMVLKECPVKPDLASRSPLSSEQAIDLSTIFKLLANDTRIREGELCVSELSEAVGMKPQAVSNQLQKMLILNMVKSRRSGNQIYYRIIDPCICNLIDRGLCFMEETFKQTRGK
jgi:DNA-binding transcriptional ArsR family regulator